MMTVESQQTNAFCRTCMSADAVHYSLFNIKKKLDDELFTISDMITLLTSLEVKNFFSPKNGKVLCKMCVIQYNYFFLSHIF